jgi:hypothetical protein
MARSYLDGLTNFFEILIIVFDNGIIIEGRNILVVYFSTSLTFGSSRKARKTKRAKSEDHFHFITPFLVKI